MTCSLHLACPQGIDKVRIKASITCTLTKVVKSDNINDPAERLGERVKIVDLESSTYANYHNA